MTLTKIRDVLKNTDITASAGLGTNLYLAKVAMDIVAMKAPADKDGYGLQLLRKLPANTFLWSTGLLQTSSRSVTEKQA